MFSCGRLYVSVLPRGVFLRSASLRHIVGTPGFLTRVLSAAAVRQRHPFVGGVEGRLRGFPSSVVIRGRRVVAVVRRRPSRLRSRQRRLSARLHGGERRHARGHVGERRLCAREVQRGRNARLHGHRRSLHLRHSLWDSLRHSHRGPLHLRERRRLRESRGRHCARRGACRGGLDAIGL